jgi:hypothetical protein
MKAQAWWAFRSRVYKTWRAVVHGDVYPADELVSFDSTMTNLHALIKELAQPTRGVSSGTRMIVNKKPAGTKSPNMADSVIMAFFPAPENVGAPIVGSMRQ